MRVDAGAARHRRQQRRDRIADAGRVVLGGPARQRDDVRRHERVGIEDLPNRLDVAPADTVCHAIDHDACDESRSKRHDNARADRRRVRLVRDGVGQEFEMRNGDGDVDEHGSIHHKGHKGHQAKSNRRPADR